MPRTRTETDSIGPIEVPENRLWGAQTERALRNFRISRETMPEELVLVLDRGGWITGSVQPELFGLDDAMHILATPEEAGGLQANARAISAAAGPSQRNGPWRSMRAATGMASTATMKPFAPRIRPIVLSAPGRPASRSAATAPPMPT